MINNETDEYKYNITDAVFRIIKKDSSPPVFMCVGNSRIDGDNLGPAIGEMLISKQNIRTYVYGTCSNPITASNVIAVYNFVKQNHNNKLFVIDAAVSKNSSSGQISIYKGGLTPAAAFGKGLPEIGDYSMIYNIGKFFNQPVVALLQHRQNRLKNVAETIAKAIGDALILQRAYSINKMYI